ncbi:endoglucanase-like [Macrosteles quadrilineatus]|uniref:endoglucanase-like n=1 Tax=Macrosteles quadrilineatus TaxID=74068 RepID=UPI0023E17CBE|nr:endoglucanase-like [Macrosteles quadrilineatus]
MLLNAVQSFCRFQRVSYGSYAMRITIICILSVIGAVYSTVQRGKQNFPMLRGVNRSGTEYACIKGDGIFDSPYDDATIENMKKWNINIVRVPLNEGCWFARWVPRAEYAGDNYQTKIKEWVQKLRGHGLYVIVELHWTEGLYKGPAQGACYEYGAKCQKPMPNQEVSIDFWKDVANMFKGDEGIIFDLFNEPFPDRAIEDRDQAWRCWKNGGDDCPGFEYRVAGMQDLVYAVRNTGAKNLIMLGGLNFANDLEGWTNYLPYDPAYNVAASMHSYNFNSCIDKKCWDKGIGTIIKTHPVIVGEIGENDCSHQYIDKLMPYLEERGISYLGWTWNNWNCKDGPSLVKNYDGEPTKFGIGFKNFLAKVAHQ